MYNYGSNNLVKNVLPVEKKIDNKICKISETNEPRAIKFHMTYTFSGTKVSLKYRVEWIKPLVTMATDRSHRVIMAKTMFSYFLASN